MANFSTYKPTIGGYDYPTKINQALDELDTRFNTAASFLGTVAIAGALTVGSAASGAAMTLGASAPSANSASIVRHIVSNTQRNWQVDVNSAVSGAGAMSWTPSTVGGGTTFTTPVMLLNSSGALTLTGQIKSTGSAAGSLSSFMVDSTAPAYGWRNSGAAVDNRTWDIFVNGTTIQWRAVNDANSAVGIGFSMTRSGTTISGITLGASTTISGRAIFGTAFVPGFAGANDIVVPNAAALRAANAANSTAFSLITFNASNQIVINNDGAGQVNIAGPVVITGALSGSTTGTFTGAIIGASLRTTTADIAGTLPTIEFYNTHASANRVIAKITSDGDGISQNYGTLKFYTGQAALTEYVRISSTGLLSAFAGLSVTGTGTFSTGLRSGATAGVISAAEFLTVDSGASVIAAGFKNSVSATVTTVGIWHAATTGDNLWLSFYSDAAGTLRGSIDYNRAGGLTRYNTTSDYRLKNLCGIFGGSGEMIDNIPVHLGMMRGATMWRPMFVAHEVQQWLPWAVSGEKDGPTYQTLSEMAMIPALWAESQSLRRRVKALEDQPWQTAEYWDTFSSRVGRAEEGIAELRAQIDEQIAWRGLAEAALAQHNITVQ